MKNLNFVRNTFNEKYIYEVSRDLFLSESAYERIKYEFKDRLKKPERLHIFIGTDSGNLIHYLLNGELPRSSRFIFIEPTPVKKLIKETLDLLPEKHNIWLIDPEEFESILSETKFSDYCFLEAIELHRSLSAEYGFLAEYRSLYWDISSRLDALKWSTVTSISTAGFIKNQLLNVADNQNSIATLQGILKKSTAVVLAGGPSLDLHIDWVTHNREDLYVFAVSRISKRLLEIGLTPDFILSCDPTDESYQISREMLEFNESVIFINEYHVAPKLLKQWPHNKFFTHQLLPWESELNPKTEGFIEPSGPTITNLAVSTAAWLGAGRIILLGVDFCFTQDGYTHALGSKERAAGPRFDLNGLTVFTNQGNRAYTEAGFVSAINSLSITATKLRSMGIELLTLSSNAAKIDGVDYVLSESISLTKKVKFNPSDKITAGNSYLNNAKFELQSKLYEIRDLKNEIKNAINIHNKMYNGSHVSDLKKSELEEIDRRILNNYPESFSLIKSVSIRGLLRMSNSVVELEDLNSIEIKSRLTTYYNALYEGCSWLIKLLEQSIECVGLRIRELNPTEKDLFDLAQRWIENGEAGRYKLPWANKALPESLKDALHRAYEEEMNRDYLQQLALVNRERSLKSLPSRIIQFYDSKDTIGLTQLADSLTEYEEGKHYLPLVQAYNYLLQDKKAEALSALLPVTEDPDSPILEQALVKLFSLCNDLGFQQSSLDALAALSCVNKSYLEKYADALASNNQIADAIDHEIEYLHYYKADERSLSKLRKWYKALGINNVEELIIKLR